jgi:hypothetical protein
MNNIDLVTTRVKAFAIEAMVLIILGIAATLSSDAFSTLLITHYGELWGGGAGVLIVNGIVKHLLNIKAVEDYRNQQVGSNLGQQKKHLILI